MFCKFQLAAAGNSTRGGGGAGIYTALEGLRDPKSFSTSPAATAKEPQPTQREVKPGLVSQIYCSQNLHWDTMFLCFMFGSLIVCYVILNEHTCNFLKTESKMF